MCTLYKAYSIHYVCKINNKSYWIGSNYRKCFLLSFFCVTAHAKKLTWQKQNNFQIWISNFMYVNRKNAMISYH